MEDEKKIVYYDRNKGMKLVTMFGVPCAIVYPLNHTSSSVSNESCCCTSEVVSTYNNGRDFETINSLYVAVYPCQLTNLNSGDNHEKTKDISR